VNLASIIEDHESSRAALIDGDTVISYGELRARAGHMRQVLAERGIGPDDRVTIIAGNEPLFVTAALGVIGVGARMIPIKPTNPLLEIQRKLTSIDPALVLVGADASWVLDHAAEIDADLLDLTTLDATAAQALSATTILDRADNDVALMMLTSGVSGEPKVAMLTHRNLLAAQEAISTGSEDGLRGDDVLLGSLPFAHIFGLNAVLLTGLRVGATIILERRFDLAQSLELVREHKITVLAGAPPMWRLWGMTDAPAGTFDSVRIALSGAAALPAEVAQRMADRHGVAVEEGYGMTETASVLTTNRGLTVKAGSVGKPLPGIDLVLVE